MRISARALLSSVSLGALCAASLACAALLSVAGCGDDGTVPADSSTTDSGTGDVDSGALDSGGGADTGTPPVDAGTFVPGGERFTVNWGPVTAASGEEDTRCIVARMGNAEQVRIGQIINDLGPASHHMIVYRVTDTVEQLTPFACDPFADTLDPSRGSPLTVSQSASETITLPEGVAYTLAADQMIRLELHYINTTPAPVAVAASSTFVSIAPETFQHEADFLFIGNPDIDIPARSTYTVGPSYFPLPGDLAAAEFFSITGHTHQYGTDVTVETTPGAGGAGSPVYDVAGWDWDEPDTVYHDPPFTVPAGGGFRFSCEYDNTSDSNVGFGESANSEMCFFWAYYYPSQGPKVCVHSDEYSVDICCPGSPLCSVILGAL